MTEHTVSIDICVCTYQRTHVVQTLESLAALVPPEGVQLRVIVADNDETPSAQAIVEEAASNLQIPVYYLHAPAANISIARNACLNAADADFVAFIDDDELASAGWIKNLLDVQRVEDADIVLGPVDAIYESDQPSWMFEGDFHSTRPVWVNGRIITGYSCNVLIKRNADSVKGQQFRIDLGKTGGEDSAFFDAIHRAGGKIAYAPDALVTENVPDSRASFKWLWQRRFRAGQTHGIMLKERLGDSMKMRIIQTGIATVKAVFCHGVAVLNIFDPPEWRGWLLRGSLHLGAISWLLGQKKLIQYGQTEIKKLEAQ